MRPSVAHLPCNASHFTSNVCLATNSVGDKVKITKPDDGGWSEGLNTRTGKSGLFPTAYVKLQS